MTASVKKYQNALKKKLYCSGSAKSKLLDQFISSVSAFTEDNPSPTFEELVSAFGPPEEMATVLMAEISEPEKLRYHRAVLLQSAIAGVLVAAFLAFTGYIYICKEYSNITIDDTVVIDIAHEDLLGE